MEYLLIIKWVLCFIMTAYCVLITIYFYSWMTLPAFISRGFQTFTTKISIIIPARNEEDNIENCLHDLIKQSYPKELLEILIIDDNSSDETYKRALRIKQDHPESNIHLISLKEEHTNNAYKKNAISQGILKANGSLIITTDADCRYNKHWVATLTDYYERYKPKFISAPVCFKDERTMFQRMQTLEFISLIGIGASAIKLGQPLMCNGANLAFERDTFVEVKGYDTNEGIASGDDIFLMLKIADKHPSGIHFLMSLDATVYTYAKKNVKEFYQQRKRWASKGMHYKNGAVTAVAMLTYFANLAWLINFILIFFYASLMPMFLLQTAARMVVESLYLLAIAAFFKRKSLLLLYIPTFFLNILYVILIGAAGSLGSYEWKGRIVK